VLDTRPAAEPSRYRVRLATPFDRVTDVFPAATFEAGDAFIIDVSGPAELSERVGALIGLGALIAAVEPLRQPLEERVRAALQDGS
jgi:hypothetical protein